MVKKDAKSGAKIMQTSLLFVHARCIGLCSMRMWSHGDAPLTVAGRFFQNITVGVSFGRTRELAFLHAKTGTKIYFPQTNGMLFSFGRDVNILWKHGVNALSDEEQHLDSRGRVSIILWGLVSDVREEGGSPPMLPYNDHGKGGYDYPNPRERGASRSGAGRNSGREREERTLEKR